MLSRVPATGHRRVPLSSSDVRIARPCAIDLVQAKRCLGEQCGVGSLRPARANSRRLCLVLDIAHRSALPGHIAPCSQHKTGTTFADRKKAAPWRAPREPSDAAASHLYGSGTTGDVSLRILQSDENRVTRRPRGVLVVHVVHQDNVCPSQTVLAHCEPCELIHSSLVATHSCATCPASGPSTPCCDAC